MKAALRFKFLTPHYDILNRIASREQAIKSTILDLAQLQEGHAILDIGCGTGTLLRMACEREKLHVVGIDPDPKMISQAHEKLKTGVGSSTFQLSKASSTNLALPSDSFDSVMSSLVFHHLSPIEKKAAMLEAFRVLKPGSVVIIADWGKPSNFLMRAAFYFVQVLDGFENTRENVQGRLPIIMSEAGFTEIDLRASFSTIVGSVRIHTGRKT